MLNDTATVVREPVIPANFSAPYWEATRERRLVLQFCPRSGQFQFYPRPLSVFSGKRELEWRESPGKGALYTYTISRVGLGPFREATPFAIGLIELDEGPRIMGGLVGCTQADLQIGMRVKPHWLAINDGFHLLQFQPDRAEG